MLCVGRQSMRRVLVSAQAARLSRPVAVLPSRTFSSAAAVKVVKTLDAEIKHEDSQYEQAKEIKAFLKQSEFKLVEADGDVNLALERAMGEKTVKIEWQLSSPFMPEEDMEGGEMGSDESTDFSVTIESKSGDAGLTFYCSTQTGEDHRYVIGNVRSWASAEEKERVSAYNGPDFEDVDEKLQEALDEYLAELGMNNEVCDLMDALASDKEQREYLRWLKITKKFLE